MVSIPSLDECIGLKSTVESVADKRKLPHRFTPKDAIGRTSMREEVRMQVSSEEFVRFTKSSRYRLGNEVAEPGIDNETPVTSVRDSLK